LERDKNKQKLISDLGEKYFSDITSSYIYLAEKGIFNGTENCSLYLQKPYTQQIIRSNLSHNRALNNYEANQRLITVHLTKLDVMSEKILKSGIELTEFRYSLTSRFISQTEKILIFLTICRNADGNFGESIIELYEKWGGETGDIIERISNIE
jgi:hypothetical protein